MDRPYGREGSCGQVLAFYHHGSDGPAEFTRTGAPGRPSVMHILRNELAERCKAGEIESSLAEQVRVLREWFGTRHPQSPVPAQTTTENGLRAQYRAAQKP